MVALAAWNAIGVDRIPHSERRDRRIMLVVLPMLGFLAFFRYLPMLAHAPSSSPKEKSYSRGRRSSGRSRSSTSASSCR
jgi:hypothetical protein